MIASGVTQSKMDERIRKAKMGLYQLQALSVEIQV